MFDKLVRSLIVVPARLLGNFESLLLLAVRWWVAWDFLKSGWLKITNWQNTLFLFDNEYHVPLLPSNVAAVVGTAGELAFPVLLFAGLTSRLGALGLSAVNIMAVVSYADVLLSEGFEGALGQHYLWGFGLIVVMVFGPGKVSLDQLLLRGGPAKPARGMVAAAAV
jgi:putative oxidoreductase